MRARAHFLVAALQIFEVTSTTTIRELCDTVASRLQLSSATGYGLYLKTRKKVRLRVSLQRHVTSQDADMLGFMCVLEGRLWQPEIFRTF